MDDPLDAAILKAIDRVVEEEHQAWLATHEERKHKRWMQAERWGDEEWNRCRALAEERWHGTGFFVFEVLDSARDVHFDRLERKL